MTTILGVDPGLVHTGYAVLDEATGKLVGSGLILFPDRGYCRVNEYLDWILPRLDDVVREHRPMAAGVEEVTWQGRRQRVTMPLSHVAGAVAALLWARKVSVYMLLPHMKKGVDQRRPRAVESEHEYDAVLLARKVRAWLRAKSADDASALKQLSAVGARNITIPRTVRSAPTSEAVRPAAA